MRSRIRKFYLHSKLNFGIYSGKTVAEVIAMGEGPYLRWCEAKMRKIAFASECDLKRFSVGHDLSSDEDLDWDDGHAPTPGADNMGERPERVYPAFVPRWK
jgi:hypothetical protein